MYAILDLDRCPHCRVDSPFLDLVPGWNQHQTRSTSEKIWKWWRAYYCRKCGGVVLAEGYHSASTKFEEGQEVCKHYPAIDTLDEAIPPRARNKLQQALDTLSSPSASVLMSAASVDEMLKEKDLKDGSLYARIKKAADQYIITESMAEWAHDVRLDANDERHADQDAAEPVIEDARRCVDFAKALAQYLFVLPERVRCGKQAAKQATAT